MNIENQRNSSVKAQQIGAGGSGEVFKVSYSESQLSEELKFAAVKIVNQFRD
jgi:hypothetical protein